MDLNKSEWLILQYLHFFALFLLHNNVGDFKFQIEEQKKVHLYVDMTNISPPSEKNVPLLANWLIILNLQLVSISKKTKSHSSFSSRHWISNFEQTLIFCLLSVVICLRKIFLAQESKLFRQRWCLFGDHDYWETKTFSMCMNDLLPRKADDRHYLLPNFTIMG